MKSKKFDDGIKRVFTKNSDGTEDAVFSCKKCGALIDHSDKYGTWCTNNCGREEAKELYIKFMKLFK